MADVLKSGSALTLPLAESDADAVSLTVEIAGAVVWGPTQLNIQGNTVTFPAEASVITETSAFAYFVVKYTKAGEVIKEDRNEVIIESQDLLRVLDNSFGTWADLSLAARYMVNIVPFNLSEPDQQKAALIQAYHNIGDVHVDFCPPHRRARYQPQNRMWDDTGIFESNLERIYSTRQLKPETWARVHQDKKDSLIKAQIIEANFLLSGLTPEKQRLSGLLSHSAGESAHFYRTTKPLELPVCRATALALKGIISYVTRIAG
ncbi:hypothetical protein CNR34_00018 [Pseudomonas phage nickie]|uniref:Uncharacterized protein n=1 Tax=Pseudomonas phage nickie TaxID=2048977 RepID=A0A2H4P700_9CAUD|nr:hypothetical protein FDJ16_gp147 [Pseudomonas phage nickie]ATW57951.1 hypothetical protein CNR34_00018 [Pseudomonas phage nickie]